MPSLATEGRYAVWWHETQNRLRWTTQTKTPQNILPCGASIMRGLCFLSMGITHGLVCPCATNQSLLPDKPEKGGTDSDRDYSCGHANAHKFAKGNAVSLTS